MARNQWLVCGLYAWRPGDAKCLYVKLTANDRETGSLLHDNNRLPKCHDATVLATTVYIF